MQPVRRRTGRRQIAGLSKLAISPCIAMLQLANGAVFDKFTHTVEVRVGMALSPDLRSDLVLFLQVSGSNYTSFGNAAGDGLFQVNVKITVYRPVADESVRVIQGAADNRVDPLVVETFSPVDIFLCFGKSFICWQNKIIKSFVLTYKWN